MHINPLSHTATVSGQLPQPTSRKPAQSQPADSVQLSSAATKALQGGDVDHDGDSH